VTVIVRNPHVESLIEVLKMVAQPPERLEIDTGQINVANEDRLAGGPRLGVQQLVDISHVDNEVMETEEDAFDVTRNLGALELREASSREGELSQCLSNVNAPLSHVHLMSVQLVSILTSV
jgi:hypothetical protein